MATQSPLAASTPCPDLEGLRQLVLGELPVPALDQMAQHLEQCSHCVQTVHGLQIGDTLTDALRKSAAVEVSEEPVVSSLIAKLSGLRPVPATPIPGPGATGVAAFPQATHDLHGLLAPARGPDELGWVGPYRILGVLGGGGMGLVLQAEDPQLKRQVALKVMKPQLAINPAARQRFLREAQAAAAVTHDHIVTIYQVGEERGMPFIAMPLLAGESLDDRLKREGRLPVPEVLRIGREIAAGLAAAHERGLIHRQPVVASDVSVWPAVISNPPRMPRNWRRCCGRPRPRAPSIAWQPKRPTSAPLAIAPAATPSIATRRKSSLLPESMCPLPLRRAAIALHGLG